jgi:SAM-dependent methyltransferase
VKLNSVQRAALARHLEKLRDGQYQTEIVECPICGTVGDEKLAAKDRYGIPLSVVICRRCGLIRTNPRMKQDAYMDFYRTEYRPLYGGEAGPTPAFFNDQKQRGRAIRRFLDGGHAGRWDGRLVVEAGCGAGGVLQAFADAGAQTIGCDFDEDFLAYGRQQHQLDLRYGPFGDLVLPRAPDLIVYSHVLEHLLDVRGELRLVRKALAPAGRLFIEIPSVKGIHGAYRGDFLQLLQNAHTLHFSLQSLVNLLGVEGFSLERGNELTQAEFRVGPPSIPKNDYPDVMRYLRRTKNLRFLNLLHPARQRQIIRSVLAFLGIKAVLSRLLGRSS